jgi:hypothetical protein
MSHKPPANKRLGKSGSDIGVNNRDVYSLEHEKGSQFMGSKK